MSLSSFMMFGMFSLSAAPDSLTSVSISKDSRVMVTPVCDPENGPEVLIQLKNTSPRPMSIPLEFLPWSGGAGHISFFSSDEDIDVANWVGHLHGRRKIKLEQNQSIEGSAPIWDRVEPKSVGGRRTLRWEYGKMHSGYVEIDFGRCPITWQRLKLGGDS